MQNDVHLRQCLANNEKCFRNRRRENQNTYFMFKKNFFFSKAAKFMG